jgi:serine/threonine-protein kinase
MPVIDRERWTVLEPLLDRALELTPEQLVPWLEELSESAPDIAAELSALLTDEASATRDGFLSQPLDLTLQGLEMGAYTLERPLGHGGMGSVWLARRTDGRFEGHAAVKLLNLSLLSTAGQERFRREGSLLARLAHPGIARLLDAGVSRGGQPYLVLEYVDGKRLDAYAIENMLSSDDRIRLFLRVLEAVGHAHANLIVHRDLKPSNILVKADGGVKLLDFGIAKLADDDLETTAITIEGGRVFTPQFAAPEQVRGDTITTATDVYALGVILYMMLSGRHPTGMETRTAADVVRALLEVEPEPLEPRDLGAVVGKALRKDPKERYQNVEAFADDLERYLRHEPVSVARDAFTYRARKFVRRHRAAVGVGLAIAGILVTATTFSIKQMREARRQRDVAVRAGKRADAQAEFASMLMSQLGGRPMTAREILDRARTALDHQHDSDAGFMASALVQLSSKYYELGDMQLRSTLLARAESLAFASQDISRLVQVRCNSVDNLRTQGKYAEAERLAEQAVSMLKRAPDPNVEAECLLALANLENEVGNPEKSGPAVMRALAIRDSLGQRRDLFYVDLLDALGYTLDRQNKPREAVVVARHAIALMDTTGRGETTNSAIMRHNLGATYNRLGEVAVAESIFADVLQRLKESDPTGRLPQQPLIHYGHAALYQGDADSAAKYFSMLAEQSAADHNRYVAEGDTNRSQQQALYWQGRALFGLAQAELLAGRAADAGKTIERFRPISTLRDLRNSDDQVVDINTLDALVALSTGDTARADDLLGKTLTKAGYFTGRRNSVLHSTLILAARIQLALGHPDSALVFARDARRTATRDSLSETRSARVGEARLIEARAELQQGNAAAARLDAERALTALRVGGGPKNPRTIEAEQLLARLSRR